MAVKYKEYTPDTYKESDQLIQAGQDMNYWKDQNLQNFQYDDFVLSDEYNNANDALNNLVRPGDFSYSQQQGMNDLWNQIQNREKFTYDVNGDALYQQYKDQYITGGKMAMMDTMGQAAAMTGGYGNSYAQSVGQQAYQGYLQQLTDKIPELYNLALAKYQMEGDELMNKYSLHTDQYNREYGQHRDSVSDYNADRNYLAGRADSIYNRDLGIYTTNRDTALAENESYNNNIVANREYYTDVYNSLRNTEWSQHMDNETIRQAAINIANDNLYRNEQSRIANDQLRFEESKFQWQKDQSNLQAENDALRNQYVVDDKAAASVSNDILSEEEFMEAASSGISRTSGGGLFGLPSFSRNYTYNGATYNSYSDYVEDTIRRAYNNGDINEATVNALLEQYGL